MKKTRLYLLALPVAAIGLGWAGYKWQVLKFPIKPDAVIATPLSGNYSLCPSSPSRCAENT